MNVTMKIGVFALTAVLLAGCAEDPEERALVNQLKVLGMRADLPETQPGTTVTLDALVADPLGGGRAVTRAWAICEVDPAEGTASCAEPERLTSLGSGDTATLAIPADALAMLPEAQQESGIEIAVILTVTAGAESDTALKRVRVSTRATPNRNPAFRELTIAGAIESPTMVQMGSEVEVVAAADAASLESWVDAIGQPQVEEMRFTWLMTAGSLADAVSFGDAEGVASTTWTAEGAPSATIWVVMRDGRGGIAWQERTVLADR